MRLRDYDYAQAGAYFVTIVAMDRACLFGEVVSGEMLPNEFGRIVQTVWDGLPDHYSNVECDAFIVMPNHVHGVIVLADDGGVGEFDVGVGLKPARGWRPVRIRPRRVSNPPLRCWKSFGRSKHFLRAVLTNCAIRPVSLCGSAIITNTSFAAKTN